MRARARVEGMLQKVCEVNRKAGHQGGTEVNHGLPGLADAILAGVGATTGALWKASGQHWLLVTGTRVPGRDRYGTKVRRIKAETFDEAWEAMAAAVGAAKQTKARADDMFNAVRRYGRGGASGGSARDAFHWPTLVASCREASSNFAALVDT